MAINIPTINERFLDNNGQVNSTWYNYLRTGGASNIGDVLPNFFIVSGAYIQASNYWLNLSVDNGWLSGDTYQGAYADLLKLSDASSVNIRFTTSDARDTEIATYGESGAFVLDTNNKRFKIPMVTKTIGNLSALADIGTVFGNSAASGSAVYAGVKFPYFMKVGNKTLEASTVDLKKEAEDQKAAISSLGQAQLEAISSAGIVQVDLVNAAGVAQVTAVNNAGTIQYDAITLNGTTWKNDIIATGTLWKNDIIDTGSAQVGLVESAGTTQMGLVNTAGDTQIGLVNTAGDTQVTAVNNAGTIQYDAITLNGTTWKNDIIATGTLWKNDIIDTGSAQVGLVESAGTTQMGLVNTAGDTQIGLVNTAGDTQVGLVEDEGNTQVARVISEGNTQVGLVETEGAEQIAIAEAAADEAAGYAAQAGTSALPLFTPLYLDYNPENSGYVLSDGTSYVSGAVYTTAYDHLVDDYTSSTDTTETVGGVTVTYRRAADGHKIIDVANIANYTAVLAATGTAWYYVLDTTNTRFMLPFTNWFIQGGATTYGSTAAYTAAGLPNITAAVGGFVVEVNQNLNATGAAAAYNGNRLGDNNYWIDQDNDWQSKGFNIDASRSSSIYGASTTVQPQSNKLALYFVCGNTVTNEYLIDAAGLASKDFVLNQANPVSAIIMAITATVPTGYLYCNGAAVSRTTYAALFAILGTLYGAGDGTTTFNLPDFRGRFLRGYDGTRSAAVGTPQADGLPNITGTLVAWLDVGIFSRSQVGVFANDTSGNTSRWPSSETSGGNSSTRRVSFNASSSNAIYGNSSYVTPYNHAVYYYIKY